MRKFLLYGMGETAESFVKISDYLFKNLIPDFKIIGVTDSYATEENEGEEFFGLPILANSEIGEIEGIEAVIVAASDNLWDIKDIVKNKYPNVNITDINTFLLQYCIGNDKQLAVNRLFKFFLKEKHRYMTKWMHYFNVYDKYFSPFVGKDIVFCEIGIFKGGSLQMWKNYFGPNATIIGIDINEECKEFEEENIHVEIGSQADPEFWRYIKKKYPRIDILLDDGGHEMEMQKITFECMFPHISDGGIYMCEDTHTSYMPVFGGGYKKEGTFVEYSKEIVDVLNRYWYNAASANRSAVSSIHFYDSIIVMEKNLPKISPITFSSQGEFRYGLDSKLMLNLLRWSGELE